MEDMSPKETNGPPSFAHGLQILMVDHDTLSLMRTASMLEKYSFKVTTTELASLALSMIREQKDHYGLVMADFNMPEKDRSSFLQVLHKNEIPVIFMSSEVNINVAKKALAEGACFFLQKPISTEDLKNVWQHVYWKVRTSRKDTYEPNCAEKINEAGDVNRPPTGGMRIHDVTGHDLVLDRQDTRTLTCESGKVCIAEGNREREVQCSRAEPQIATENHAQRADGIKRPIDDKEEQEKGAKVKLNTEQTVSESTNNNEEEMENQDCNGSSKEKKWHPVWTTELHRKFTAAISALGDQKAHPRPIQKWMNVPNITLRQVASHLQKYRKQVHRIQEAGTASLPSLSRSSSWNNRNEFPPARQTSLVYEQGTSSFGVQGNPTQLMTLNSFTGFNDYRRQNLYSEHTVMCHNTNHRNESLYDFYLRTHGKFQDLDQILEADSFTLGADMNEIERNQPLGLEESMFKVSERTLPSMNYLTPEFASPYMSANTFQVPNASAKMNQAQNYCPAPTAPFNAQNQQNFSAEATRTTEVGMNQAQFYTLAPTTPINSQNQNHFSTEVTGITEVGMNQAPHYTPAQIAPINFQNQNHFSAEIIGTSDVLKVVPEQIASVNVTNAETFPANFTGGSQQLCAAAREAHPSSSNNNQPMLEYDDLLKLLEEDPEEFNCFESFDTAPTAGDAFDSAPNAGDANRYWEWLPETLFEKR